MTEQILHEQRTVFDHLFVLEVANNHWGDLDRGKRLIDACAASAIRYGVRAAIKLQFRDVKNFIHRDFLDSDLRYVKKTLATALSVDDYATLIAAIRASGCIPMATPFDEASVQLCVDLDLPIIKLASADVGDLRLEAALLEAGRPVIASLGGVSDADAAALVQRFRVARVPLALNHCVSRYPCPDEALSLDRIDALRQAYPHSVIGFSTHECGDMHSSLLLSYGKGASMWERHVDLGDGEYPLSPYCATPKQLDAWFAAYNTARTMCRPYAAQADAIEHTYLNGLRRGLYARRSLSANTRLCANDFYAAVPLQPGCLSTHVDVEGLVLREALAEHDALQQSACIAACSVSV